MIKHCTVLLFLLFALGPWPTTAQAAGPVVVAEVQGVINPLTNVYVRRALSEAEGRGAQLLVLTLNTPGGLESSMREIVEALLQSPVPTAVFVAPGGARATSAGLFITLAANVAAMAPATHLGAAHPVGVGVDLDEIMAAKVTSDAAALIRAVAEERGRNVDWPERAVRENLSLTASEALSSNVIDLVAADLPDLLRQLHGRQVTTVSGAVTLQTEGTVPEALPMNIVENLMHAISDPNIAYLLLSMGTLFLLTELANPGLSVAGIASAVSYVLALMALGSLPVNWAGVALLGVAGVFFLVGLLTDTEAIVSVAGLVPFVLGSLLLFSPFAPTSPAAPDVRVSPWLIVVVGGSILLFTLGVLRAVIRAARLPPQSGAASLVGKDGVAVSELSPSGQVKVELQEWSAVAVGGDIPAGTAVRVIGIVGVRLQVVPLGSDQTTQGGS